MNAIIALAIFEAIQQNRFEQKTFIDEMLEIFNRSQLLTADRRINIIYKIADQIEALNSDYNK